MKKSLSDRSMYSESSDAEDGVGDEEQQHSKVRAEEPDDDSNDSDSSSAGSPSRSRLNSFSTAWPQSYRQSIDIYSGVAPPSIEFLGTPNLSRFGSSFLNNSFRGRHTSGIISSFIKPLLPTSADDEQQHRKSSHTLHAAPRKCSFTQGVFNGVNVLCGVGILSAPYAIKEGGWLGLAMLFIYGILAFYTGVLLCRCLDSEPGLQTYPDIGEVAFGSPGRIIVSIILYMELYVSCVEYIILDSDNFSSLFPNAKLDIGGIHLDSHLLFAIMITLVVLPTTWLPDLSYLSYISAGGVVASILAVACLFWVGLIDNIGYKKEGSLLNLSGFSIAIGLYGSAYSGHSILPNIYSSLKKKNEYPSVLFTSFLMSTLLFAGAAVMGFLLFGESTQSQFTLNVPQQYVASKIAVWTTVMNPITKYSITLTPMALSLEELILADRQKSHWYAIIIRTILTISTLAVAMSVPFFGLVMALIGSLLTMLLALIFPCACFLKISRSKTTWSQVAMCALVLIVGGTSSTVGTYSAISKIIKNLS